MFLVYADLVTQTLTFTVFIDHYKSEWDSMRFTIGAVFVVASLVSLVGFVMSFRISHPAEGVVAINNVRKYVLGMLTVLFMLEAIHLFWDPDGKVPIVYYNLDLC
jgi:hypothetical protein